ISRIQIAIIISATNGLPSVAIVAGKLLPHGRSAAFEELPRTGAGLRSAREERNEMALNTRVDADANAPPVTRRLAEFVAHHPAKGWEEAVDHQARRTFINWLGCAIGAANHETMQAARAAIAILEPAPQATVLGQTGRVDIASAALLNGTASHTDDFD